MFLAAKVEILIDGVAQPLDLDTLQRMPSGPMTEIEIRAFDQASGLVNLLEFRVWSDGAAKLGQIRMFPPTRDDQQYLHDIEKFDVRPVDIDGVAWHESETLGA